ncbi:MAG: hypothetical protein ABSE46_25275 [Terracidiphilus sp.]
MPTRTCHISQPLQFVNSDVEMSLRNRQTYQVRTDGRVVRVGDDAGTLFNVVVRFSAGQAEVLDTAKCVEDMIMSGDEMRESEY